MKKSNLLSVVCACLAAVTFNVSASLITSDSDPALSGSTIINFDGTSTQNATSFTFGDVIFSTTSGTLRIAPFSEGGIFGGSGQDLSTTDTANPSSFTITFATPVSAFGMNWGAANPDWTVDLFDSSDNLLESLVFIGGDSTASFIEFYGASINGISRAELATTGYDWVKIDNFEYVSSVPIPAAVWLFGSGLLGLIGMARRKKAI